MKKGDIVYIRHYDGIWSAFVRSAGQFRVTIESPKPIVGPCTRYPYHSAYSPHEVFAELLAAKHDLMKWLRNEKAVAETRASRMSEAIIAMYDHGYTDSTATEETENEEG